MEIGRRKPTTTPRSVAEIRAEADEITKAAEVEARRVLEHALEAADKLEVEADERELADRLAAAREEIRQKAATAANGALEARTVAVEASVDADHHESRRRELQERLAEEESLRRRREVDLLTATADGDLDLAHSLEQTLEEVDLDSLRAEVARAAAAMEEAAGRAARAAELAEQLRGEADDHRASIADVERKLRLEFDGRRDDRARQQQAELIIFDSRHLAYATATEAAADQLARDLSKRPRSTDSSSIVDDRPIVRVDENGKFLGLELPLRAA